MFFVNDGIIKIVVKSKTQVHITDDRQFEFKVIIEPPTVGNIKTRECRCIGCDGYFGFAKPEEPVLHQ